jgi:predicted metalloprotease with PDZ domain
MRSVEHAEVCAYPGCSLYLQNSPASAAGIVSGDELLAVNLRAVRSLASPWHVEQLLQSANIDRQLCLVLRTPRAQLRTADVLQLTNSVDKFVHAHLGAHASIV